MDRSNGAQSMSEVDNLLGLLGAATFNMGLVASAGLCRRIHKKGIYIYISVYP
jgi:hypothetical protein